MEASATDCLVVGSGPSGVACAAALLAGGRRVLTIDGGVRLEDDRAAAVSRFLSNPRPEEAPWLAECDAEAERNVPRKLLFGSDFVFREVDEHLRIDSRGVGLQASLAVGGLSNVWGAAMLPHAESDIADWPIAPSTLRPHYEACLALTGLSAVDDDDLAAWLPFHVRPEGRLALSRQAALVLQRLERQRASLRDHGIRFGHARLAVSAPGGVDSGCRYCGMCMSGCPFDKIYSTHRTLRQLERDPRYSYETDIVITRVAEPASDHVVITGYRRVTRAPVELTARRVFLACGVLSTTRILLESRGLIDQPVRIEDSQYFLLPVLGNARAADVRAEPLHALSQLFIEIADPRITRELVHLQLYSYNRLIGARVRKTLGRVGELAPFLRRELENRLMMLGGYLHSRHSSGVTATLHADGRFELRPVLNPETTRLVRKVVRKLLRHSLRLGLTPIPPLLEIAEPGRGFHSGGSFPMRSAPGPLETDTLGRPFGWKRVHAVDATVLPSIPATTITLPVMVNAHRIGCAALEEDA